MQIFIYSGMQRLFLVRHKQGKDGGGYIRPPMQIFLHGNSDTKGNGGQENVNPMSNRRNFRRIDIVAANEEPRPHVCICWNHRRALYVRCDMYVPNFMWRSLVKSFTSTFAEGIRFLRIEPLASASCGADRFTHRTHCQRHRKTSDVHTDITQWFTARQPTRALSSNRADASQRSATAASSLV